MNVLGGACGMRKGIEFKKQRPSSRGLGAYYWSSRVTKVAHPYRRRVVNILLWKWSIYTYLDIYE